MWGVLYSEGVGGVSYIMKGVDDESYIVKRVGSDPI